MLPTPPTLLSSPSKRRRLLDEIETTEQQAQLPSTTGASAGTVDAPSSAAGKKSLPAAAGDDGTIRPIQCEGCLESFNFEDVLRDNFDLLDQATFYCAGCTAMLNEARQGGVVESEAEDDESSDSSSDDDAEADK